MSCRLRARLRWEGGREEQGVAHAEVRQPDGGRRVVPLPSAADLGTVDVLARLRLAALRADEDLRVRDASPALRELLALTGLADLLAD